jgi:ubiquinone/menaquinone biosynthesis C-methylase UbiE
MAANYDNSAWFYDGLARLVYGNALVKAQVFLLQYILPNSNILIVGGGTGWILEELTRIYPTGLQITYVEVSANMITLSKKRDIGNNNVLFINDAIENVNLPGEFDCIITPFLFDNFTGETLKTVFEHLHKQLKPAGTWLNTDFQLTGKWWQNILLKTMFLFFKLWCRIEATRLPDIDPCFNQNGYKEIAHKSFFGDFILSKAYTKI